MMVVRREYSDSRPFLILLLDEMLFEREVDRRARCDTSTPAPWLIFHCETFKSTMDFTKNIKTLKMLSACCFIKAWSKIEEIALNAYCSCKKSHRSKIVVGVAELGAHAHSAQAPYPLFNCFDV